MFFENIPDKIECKLHGYLGVLNRILYDGEFIESFEDLTVEQKIRLIELAERLVEEENRQHRTDDVALLFRDKAERFTDCFEEGIVRLCGALQDISVTTYEG